MSNAAKAFLVPLIVLALRTGAAGSGGDSTGVSLGIDFSRNVTFESALNPLANFTNLRFAWDGHGRHRFELEGGYFYRSQDREAGEGTNAETQEIRDHFLRSAAAFYFRSRGDIALYAGPKFFYQKVFSETTQGNLSISRDLNLFGGGLVLGLERELVARLSLAGEFQALYGRGSLDEDGVGNYRESSNHAGTSASVVFRWKLN